MGPGKTYRLMVGENATRIGASHERLNVGRRTLAAQLRRPLAAATLPCEHKAKEHVQLQPSSHRSRVYLLGTTIQLADVLDQNAAVDYMSDMALTRSYSERHSEAMRPTHETHVLPPSPSHDRPYGCSIISGRSARPVPVRSPSGPLVLMSAGSCASASSSNSERIPTGPIEEINEPITRLKTIESVCPDAPEFSPDSAEESSCPSERWLATCRSMRKRETRIAVSLYNKGERRIVVSTPDCLLRDERGQRRTAR